MLGIHMHKMTELADLLFCFYEERVQARGHAKADAKMPGAQRTLEAYS